MVCSGSSAVGGGAGAAADVAEAGAVRVAGGAVRAPRPGAGHRHARRPARILGYGVYAGNYLDISWIFGRNHSILKRFTVHGPHNNMSPIATWAVDCESVNSWYKSFAYQKRLIE